MSLYTLLMIFEVFRQRGGLYLALSEPNHRQARRQQFIAFT